MTIALHEAVALDMTVPGVAEIVIDRPERHNAMNQPMYEALLAGLARCRAEPTIRCVMLRGAGGKSFIAGTDIGHFKDFHDGRQGIAYEAFVERVVDAVERVAVPTIAVIDGWAVGGGLALATACDFRLCSTGSRFGAPIARTLSNTLSSRNLARLVASLGVPRVKRMLLLAESLSAEQAEACGFVHAVVSSDQLPTRARELAERLMGLSGTTQAAVKESLRRIVAEHQLDDEDLVAAVYGSAAFRTAVAGFAKR